MNGDDVLWTCSVHGLVPTITSPEGARCKEEDPEARFGYCQRLCGFPWKLAETGEILTKETFEKASKGDYTMTTEGEAMTKGRLPCEMCTTASLAGERLGTKRCVSCRRKVPTNEWCLLKRTLGLEGARAKCGFAAPPEVADVSQESAAEPEPSPEPEALPPHEAGRTQTVPREDAPDPAAVEAEAVGELSPEEEREAPPTPPGPLVRKLEGTSLNVEVTPVMARLLGHLLETQLWGMTIEEVARRLVERGLERSFTREEIEMVWLEVPA